MIRFIAALVLTAIPFSVAADGNQAATTSCLTREKLVSFSEQLFGEHVQFAGVDTNGNTNNWFY